ncbi:hypothetical protein GQR58_030579 [Nymphon striatum]|nr:hypothetical protein GQR58_030579 [Nymphon striatum]
MKFGGAIDVRDLLELKGVVVELGQRLDERFSDSTERWQRLQLVFECLVANADRDGTDLWPRYRRRMWGLVLLGVMHGIFFFPGDILVIYAAIGAVAYRLRGLEARSLVRISVSVYGASALVWLLIGGIDALSWAGSNTEVDADVFATLSEGSFAEVFLREGAGVRRNLRPTTIAASVLAAVLTLLVAIPAAWAQDINVIVDALERDGYYIESGAEASDSELSSVIRRADSSGATWYFVALADSVQEGFEDEIYESVSPQGNVVVHFFDRDGFDNLWLSSDMSQSEADRLVDASFDAGWNGPADLFNNMVTAFSATSTTTSGSSGSSSSGGSTSSSSGGGGFPWALLAIPAVLGGGFWFMRRSSNKKKDEEELESAQKLRAGIQTELDELANDVILPDVDKLEDADLEELAELGSRISHARWQMDAAEAIMDGEPLPEKPKVPPPPAPPKPPAPREQQRQRMPQRQPRPRVPYSPSRRRSGGGLLDILIAGAGMTANRRSRGRSSGGMFGGSSRTQSRTQSRTSPRRGGGVFGGNSSSSSRRSSSSRSSSSRRANTRRSASRRARSSSRGRRRR